MLDLARATEPYAFTLVALFAAWSIVTTVRNAWPAFLHLQEQMQKDLDA